MRNFVRPRPLMLAPHATAMIEHRIEDGDRLSGCVPSNKASDRSSYRHGLCTREDLQVIAAERVRALFLNHFVLAAEAVSFKQGISSKDVYGPLADDTRFNLQRLTVGVRAGADSGRRGRQSL